MNAAVAQAAPLVDVVYKGPGDLDWQLRRAAQDRLRDGRETLLHLHVNQAAFQHTLCEFYVLDWHDEPEYRDLHQIAVIHPPAVADA